MPASTGSIPRNTDEYRRQYSVSSIGCYVSYGMVITSVSYLWYLYLVVLQKNALHEKRKKSVFPRIMYVHIEYIYAAQWFCRKMRCRKKEKNAFCRVLCTCIQSIYTVQTATFLVCQLLLQSDNCDMMSFLLVAILRSGRCYSLGVLGVVLLLWQARAAVDLQHSNFLSGGSSYFILDSFPAPSPKPNPYFYIYVLSSKLDLANFPNHIPYSAETCTVVLYCFLSNRAHLKNLISALSASCCYCSNQRPVVGLANQPGYTNRVPVDGK